MAITDWPATAVYPRELVKRALAHNAAAMILAHNHPSGIAEPSMADKQASNNAGWTGGCRRRTYNLFATNG